MSGIVARLGLGGSVQLSVRYATNTTRQSQSQMSVIKKDTYTIAAGDNFWICQQEINLNSYGEDNVVKIWDSQLVVKGPMC